MNNYEIKVTETKVEGYKSLLLSIENEKTYIHSKYNPVREARKWVTEIDYKDESIIIIIGIGMGYHVDELMNKINENNRIIIIEPNEGIYKNFIKYNNDLYKKIIESKNVNLVHYQDRIQVYNFLINNYECDGYDKIVFTCFNNYDVIFNKECKEVLEGIKSFVESCVSRIATCIYFQKDLVMNLLRNTKIALNSVKISDFKNKFDGISAVVVSAGPSLEKNIDLLKGMEDKLLIIAGGRTLKPLMDRGIKPHLVASVDPGLPNYELMESSLEMDIPMVTTLENHHLIVEQYKGKKVFINNSNAVNFDKDILDEEIPSLEAGGSVATLQISIAKHLGCDRVILIGQDLAYTNMQFHANIASDEDNRVLNIDEDYERVKGTYEEYVYTSKVLNIYRKWIENYIYRTNYECINATEGGALIEGSKVMSLNEAIDIYCKNIKKRDLYNEVENIINSSQVIGKNIDLVLDNIKLLNEDLEKGMKLSDELARLNKNLLQKYNLNKNTKKGLDKLNVLEKKLKELSNKYNLFSMPVQGLNRGLQEQLQNNKNIDQNMLFNISINYYKGLKEAFVFIKDILDEEIKKI